MSFKIIHYLFKNKYVTLVNKYIKNIYGIVNEIRIVSEYILYSLDEVTPANIFYYSGGFQWRNQRGRGQGAMTPNPG